MPIYEALCDRCGALVDYHRRVADALETPECPKCGGQTRKVIMSAPQSFVKGRFEPFKSIVDGSIICTQRDMDEHNKRNGVVCVADGYSDEDVKAGKMGGPKPKLSHKERVSDIQEAIHDLQNGYKPTIGAEDE